MGEQRVYRVPLRRRTGWVESGAQLRHFVSAAGTVITLLSFGASAWKAKSRDAAVGWTAAQRQDNLHHIVNNVRLLILLSVHRKNLTSRALPSTTRRLADDWCFHRIVLDIGVTY